MTRPVSLINLSLFSFLIYFILSPILSAIEANVSVTPEQLAQLETRIRELQSEMTTTRTEYDRLQQQLKLSEEDIGEVAEQLGMINEEMTDKQNTLKNLQAQRDKQQQLLEQQRRILAQQIRSAYLIGRQDYLKLWLNQQDPMVIGRILTYYDYINRARAEKIHAVKESLQTLQTLTMTITQETANLNQLLGHQTEHKEELDSNYDERRTILVQLKRTLTDQDKELKRLQEDKRQLEALLGGLEPTLKTLPHPNSQEFWKLKGQLAYPIQGTVIKKFGEPLIEQLKWQGLLITAERGEKVHAIAAGRVAFAEWFRQFGLLVIIDHDNGYMSLYAHNQSLLVHTGDWVETGDTIATVGDSGGKEQIALYFEIRHQGIPTNPEKWLRIQ